MRSAFSDLKSHYLLNLFVIAYFSCIITHFTIRGFKGDQFELKVIQYSLIALLMVASMIFVARTQALTMLSSSLFWVTLGTLFYFSFCAFWEVSKKYLFSPSEKNSSELGIFPLIITAIRFGFYALSMSVAQTKVKQHRVFYDGQVPGLQISRQEFPDSYTVTSATEAPGERIL